MIGLQDKILWDFVQDHFCIALIQYHYIEFNLMRGSLHDCAFIIRKSEYLSPFSEKRD